MGCNAGLEKVPGRPCLPGVHETSIFIDFASKTTADRPDRGYSLILSHPLLKTSTASHGRMIALKGNTRKHLAVLETYQGLISSVFPPQLLGLFVQNTLPTIAYIVPWRRGGRLYFFVAPLSSISGNMKQSVSGGRGV